MYAVLIPPVKLQYESWYMLVGTQNIVSDFHRIFKCKAFPRYSYTLGRADVFFASKNITVTKIEFRPKESLGS